MIHRRDFLKTALVGAGLMAMPSFLSAQAKAKNAILNQTFTLNDGVKIPKLGLGVWKIDDSIIEGVIKEAFHIGYRHIDTAQAYQNERGVGAAVNQAIKNGLKREEIFITSKVRAEYKDKKSATDSIDKSLKTMKLEYIDLMLIHTPQPWSDFRGGDYFKENIAVWEALEAAKKAGKVRSIGVSNFLQKDLKNLFVNTSTKPSVNQVLAHIGNTHFDLIDFCKKQGIYVEAYSPIAHGELLKDSRIVKMAQKYQVSPAQICIRYTLELGLISLPKSKTPAYIAQNAAVDFKISKADLEILKKLDFKGYGAFSTTPVFSGK